MHIIPTKFKNRKLDYMETLNFTGLYIVGVSGSFEAQNQVTLSTPTDKLFFFDLTTNSQQLVGKNT